MWYSIYLFIFKVLLLWPHVKKSCSFAKAIKSAFTNLCHSSLCISMEKSWICTNSLLSIIHTLWSKKQVREFRLRSLCSGRSHLLTKIQSYAHCTGCLPHWRCSDPPSVVFVSRNATQLYCALIVYIHFSLCLSDCNTELIRYGHQD